MNGSFGPGTFTMPLFARYFAKFTICALLPLVNMRPMTAVSPKPTLTSGTVCVGPATGWVESGSSLRVRTGRLINIKTDIDRTLLKIDASVLVALPRLVEVLAFERMSKISPGRGNGLPFSSILAVLMATEGERTFRLASNIGAYGTYEGRCVFDPMTNINFW